MKRFDRPMDMELIRINGLIGSENLADVDIGLMQRILLPVAVLLVSGT